MTPNWSASLVISLLVFFAGSVVIGIGMLVYATKHLKKAEVSTDE